MWPDLTSLRRSRYRRAAGTEFLRDVTARYGFENLQPIAMLVPSDTLLSIARDVPPDADSLGCLLFGQKITADLVEDMLKPW